MGVGPRRIDAARAICDLTRRFHDGTPVTAATIAKILSQKIEKSRPSGFEALNGH